MTMLAYWCHTGVTSAIGYQCVPPKVDTDSSRPSWRLVHGYDRDTPETQSSVNTPTGDRSNDGTPRW